MRTDRSSRLRRRFPAFCGATVLAVVLWLLAVLAVHVIVRPAPQLFPQRVRGVVLWPANGNPANAGAWHTLVQVMLLVALVTLVAAGLDGLRRALRRRRRAEPEVARNK